VIQVNLAAALEERVSITVGNSQTVTHYAPGISGTFPVMAEWTIWVSR
jgi:hypothetical protein